MSVRIVAVMAVLRSVIWSGSQDTSHELRRCVLTAEGKNIGKSWKLL